MFRIVVDGTAHQVIRDDGGVVRAGWPAFVVSVLVQPGDRVAEGDPVAVLESMKMESTVTAPFAGEVAAVEVVANAQVGAGAPLLRIRRPSPVDGRRPETGPLDLSGLEARPAAGTPPCERVFGALRHYLLGYDLDPADARAAARRAASARRDRPPADAGLLALRGRPARPVRGGRRALPPADRDPARRRADRGQHAGVPAGLPAVARRRPGRAAGRLSRRASRRRWPATASSAWSARRSSTRQSCGCSARSAGSASWSRS